MQNAPQALKSRLYHLQTVNDNDMWIEQCQGYPVFRKQDSIYKFKYYSLPHREISYEIIVDTNIHFERNQNGIQWTQIKQNEVMAISFKEQYGANAFWQLIQQYQRKYAIAVPAAQGILFYFQYKVPDPTTNNLPDFLAQLQTLKSSFNIFDKKRLTAQIAVSIQKARLKPIDIETVDDVLNREANFQFKQRVASI